ncbi:hypothetical protein MWH28_07165 [Natroniella sulfidigena]|uniref:hypothetical protein n=1 Tax=Natroniella sulfidigena TaxID=723921 RepID=UPI00200A93CD|nr:hypothetical protein [Natroniella sulfidigena]MCK8817138.1 hypothetical protein [Natroniella sulfidigena]
MRELTQAEKLTLRELLQMETNALTKAKATQEMIGDEALKKEAESAILAMEGRIKGMQQFINENNIINSQEVH